MSINVSLKKQLAGIRLLALDVDGVLTDGKLLFSNEGDELKAFNILDGHGIKMLQSTGVTVAIITGRQSEIVKRRAYNLKIEHVVQGREDKLEALNELCGRLNLDITQAAYMGDDLPDLKAIIHAGVGLTVPNAYHLVQKYCDHCTQTPGGEGAVREVCDLILDAQDRLESLLTQFTD